MACGSSSAMASRGGLVGHHHRERLVVSMLAPPEGRDRLLGRGIDGEVVAADPLEPDDSSSEEGHGGGVQGVVARGHGPGRPRSAR